MRTTGRLIVGLLALIGAVALAGGALWLAGGAAARPEPRAWETGLARSTRRLLIPAEARRARNPVEATAERLAAAGRHWGDHCAVCHGADGRGATEIGRGLYPRVPDMTGPATRELSDGELFWIIENGVRMTGMPAWGGEGGHGGSESSWELVHFVRRLPRLSAEERAEVERHVPSISRAELERRLAGREPRAEEPPAHGQPGHHH